MSGLFIFIVLAVVVIGLGYWNWQRTQQSIQQLTASGFEVAHDLGGQPRLLVDVKHQQIALVEGLNYRKYSFAQIANLSFENSANDEDGESFVIDIQLSQAAMTNEEVEYSQEHQGEKQFARLQSLLFSS